MSDCLSLVQKVLSFGRISNDGKQYLYLASVSVNESEYHIVSDLNKRSDKITIYKKTTQSWNSGESL